MKPENKFNNALITAVFAVLLFGLAFNAEDSNKISGAMVELVR